jgi:2-amino-4-hydroxy-6-hydroxymethyldihydropteridine diphosphokinase
VRAYIGLGSNLGDRLAYLQQAVDLLGGTDGVRILRSSRVYESEPVGGPPQPDYLNAVVEVETDLSAPDLLRACMSVEERMKRTRAVRWGPRTIDLDVLTYGRERIEEPNPPLVVPHPLMHERGFVLLPLAELDADPPLPGGRHLAEIRTGSAVLSGVKPYAPPLRVEGES